jgi:hypothetical protein
MADIRERVRRLIALALRNGNENESRNAAVQACKLINQYGLLDRSSLSVEDILFGEVSVQERPAQEPPQHQVATEEPPIIVLRRFGRCSGCGAGISPPRLVLFENGNIYHRPCWKRRREGGR